MYFRHRNNQLYLMKKKIILLAILLIIISPFLIPATQQKTIFIKASFFDVYTLLLKPDNWEKWRPDLQKIVKKDSNKISIQKHAGAFNIKYADFELKVHSGGEMFDVEDNSGNKTSYYSYLVVPQKDPKITSATVYRKTTLVNYMVGKLTQVSFADTHITDLKNFIETDSLHYGYNILKTKVPENDLIETKKEVLEKDKFKEAAKMFSLLQQYIKAHNAGQVRPVIAQFLARGKDSVQVNVGLFVNKELKASRDIAFVRMPKGGPLYVAKFNGKFNQRGKVYASLKQYFTDHGYQSAILPFETYLDNKLPVSDTSKINIQVNFSSYF